MRNGFACLFLQSTLCPLPNHTFTPGDGHFFFSPQGTKLTEAQFKALPTQPMTWKAQGLHGQFEHAQVNRLDKSIDYNAAVLQQ